MHKTVPAALATAALLAIAVSSPAQATVAEPGLTSPTCMNALTELGKQQESGKADPKTLKKAGKACAADNLDSPSAVYANITIGKHTVGAVLEHRTPSTFVLPNQWNVTSLLLNGHPITESGIYDKFDMKNKPAKLVINGETYKGKANALLGDGGASVTIATSNPVGEAITSETPTTPAKDTKVIIFSETGPKRTTIGPVYAKKWASVNMNATGTVTAEDGSLLGTSYLFGTGLDPKQYEFWKNRSYFVPFGSDPWPESNN